MTPVLSRRWLRFSLRAMLVVVTALGLWLGWEANRIHQRKLLLEALRTDARAKFDPLKTIFLGEGNLTFNGMTLRNPHLGSIPGYRRMLGDEGVLTLALPDGMTEEEVRRYENAFPEAHITRQSKHLLIMQ